MEAMLEVEVEEAAVATMQVAAGFDYRQIDEGIRDEVKMAAQVIRAQGHAMRTSILKIGRRLIEVKGMLPHGVFGEWIAAEFGMSERVGQNMMNVARVYESKSEIVSFLSDTVLYLLAAPSTPEAARAEVEQAALSGQKVTVDFAKKAAAKFTEPKPSKPRAEIKRVTEPYEAPTPTPAKVTYLEPRVVIEEDEPATEPDADELAAIVAVAAELAIEDAERAERDAGRASFEVVAVSALAPDPRIAQAREGIEAINASRIWVRDNYLELTGMEIMTLAFWRDTAMMLDRLESLIGILTRKEVTK